MKRGYTICLFLIGIVAGIISANAQQPVQGNLYPTDSVYTIQPYVFHSGFTNNMDTAGNIGIMANLGQGIIYPVIGEDTIGQGFWYQVQQWRKNLVLPPECSDSLLQNFPNPYNPTTYIPFSINSELHGRRSVHVRIWLTSLLGVNVSTIVDGYYSAGLYGVVFDARSISSGMYIYSMTIDDEKAPKPLHFMFSRKMTYLR